MATNPDWDDVRVQAGHINAIAELLDIPTYAVACDLIVPHLKTIYDTLKARLNA